MRWEAPQILYKKVPPVYISMNSMDGALSRSACLATHEAAHGGKVSGMRPCRACHSRATDFLCNESRHYTVPRLFGHFLCLLLPPSSHRAWIRLGAWESRW